MNHLSPWFVLLQCKQIHQLFLFWILFNRAAHQGICKHPNIFSINQVTKTKQNCLIIFKYPADQLLNECMRFCVAFKALIPMYFLETQRFPFPIPLGEH